MTRTFDYRAFIERWRELCAVGGIDPAEGADLSAYERCAIVARWRIHTHHARAAAAVRADAACHPFREPDDCDTDRRKPFYAIAETRARPDWWDGILQHKRQPVETLEEAMQAVRERPKPPFMPTVISLNNEPPLQPAARNQLAPYGRAVTTFAAWLEHENTPEGIAEREVWMEQNTVRKRRRQDIDQTDAERKANEQRKGVYHAGKKRYA